MDNYHIPRSKGTLLTSVHNLLLTPQEDSQGKDQHIRNASNISNPNGRRKLLACRAKRLWSTHHLHPLWRRRLPLLPESRRNPRPHLHRHHLRHARLFLVPCPFLPPSKISHPMSLPTKSFILWTSSPSPPLRSMGVVQAVSSLLPCCKNTRIEWS